MQKNLQADIQYLNKLESYRYYLNEYKETNIDFSGILVDDLEDLIKNSKYHNKSQDNKINSTSKALKKLINKKSFWYSIKRIIK